MRLLRRYFWRAVLIPTLAILGIIVGLDCLFGFIYELEGLRGDYQAMQALQFILTTTPRRVHEYLPMAILLGTLIGLGLLANSGELSVIRASGVSTLKVSGFPADSAVHPSRRVSDPILGTGGAE